MEARQTITDLDNYLRANNLYPTSIYPRKVEEFDFRELNESVNNDWKDRIEKSLITDFKKVLNNENVELIQKESKFRIVDVNSHGASTWDSFLILSDKNETLDVVINFIVNHNNAFIYLGKSHTHLNEYVGTSESLKQLFNALKKNEKVGHFYHTRFYGLTIEKPTEEKTSWLKNILKRLNLKSQI